MKVYKSDSKEGSLLENTRFLSKYFYDKKIHFPIMWDMRTYPDGVEILKKSIDIIERKEYSQLYFREWVLFSDSDSAPEFWKDLYWLNWYEERKTTIEDLIKTEKIRLDNNPYKDDILANNYYKDEIKESQEKLDTLNVIIELSKKLRALINKDYNNKLEPEFVQRLQRYEKEETEKKERGKLREEKRKLIDKEQKKQQPSEPKNIDTEKIKHSYNALLSNKYDAKKVYDCFFKGEIALCPEECFYDWFVKGNKSEKITPTLKGREGKIAIAKIRCFIETITGNANDLKDGYYNNVFGLKLNNTKTAKNLSIEHEKTLKLCEK